MTSVPMNDFEQAVYDALSARGLDLIAQVGASAYRLDLVAQHPTQPQRIGGRIDAAIRAVIGKGSVP